MCLPECWHARVVMVVGRKEISLQQTETGRKHAKCEKNSLLLNLHIPEQKLSPLAPSDISGGRDTHEQTCRGKGTVDSSFLAPSWPKPSCTGALIRFQCPAVLASS